MGTTRSRVSGVCVLKSTDFPSYLLGHYRSARRGAESDFVEMCVGISLECTGGVVGVLGAAIVAGTFGIIAGYAGETVGCVGQH